MGGERIYYRTYEEMYVDQVGEVLRYVRRNVRNNDMAVEDLTQEVFLVAYQQWETKVRNHPNIPGYLKKVAKNKMKKWFEQQSRFYMDDPELIEREALRTGADGKPDAYQMVEFLSSAEQTVPQKDLQMLRCYYEYGYKSSELSKVCGITESNFKIRIARMKEKLRNSMKIWIFLPLLAVTWTMAQF